LRPKKKIVLLEADEDQRGILRYTMRIWGYKVRGVGTAAAAEMAAREYDVDIFVLRQGLPGAEMEQLVKELNWQQPKAKVLLVTPKLAFLPAEIDAVRFDRVLSRGAATPMGIREALHILKQRKRGPRKGFAQRYPELAAELAPKKPVQSVGIEAAMGARSA